MSEEYINQLTKVFDTLNTLEERINQNHVNTELDEVMFGYSSDSTNSNVSIRMERDGQEEATSRNPDIPSTSTPFPQQVHQDESFSERKSRNVKRDRDYPDLDDDYESGYSRGYVRSGGKWKYEPHSQFIPREKQVNTKYDLLDLDCTINPLKYFEDWISATQIEIATNNNIQRMTHLEFFK